jgi:hypothetical protein
LYSMSYDFGLSFSATTSKSIASSTSSASNRRSQQRVGDKGRLRALFIVFLLSHVDVAIRVVVGVILVLFVAHPRHWAMDDGVASQDGEMWSVAKFETTK